MRYFRTSNATRNYKTQGGAFTFERLAFGNGSWSGVIDVDDDAGEHLAIYGPPIVEILETEYIELKKKNGKYFPHTEQVSQKSQEVEKQQEENVVEDLESEIPLVKVEVGDSLESK